MDIGQLIRTYRKKRGWSQTETISHYNLIHNTSFGKSTLSQYETNRRLPDLLTMRNLATLLQIPVYEVMGLPASCLEPDYTIADVLRREGLGEEDIQKVEALVYEIKSNKSIG